jgi:hypothetical protein
MLGLNLFTDWATRQVSLPFPFMFMAWIQGASGHM